MKKRVGIVVALFQLDTIYYYYFINRAALYFAVFVKHLS